MSKYQNHQNQLNKTTLHLQKCFPGARFFDRHCGVFFSKRVFAGIKKIYTIEHFKNWVYSINKFRITINKPGMSDQYVIIPIEINGKMIPVHIEREEKSGKAVLSKEQKHWRKICKMMHVKFIESRNAEDVEKEIREYIKWLQS